MPELHKKHALMLVQSHGIATDDDGNRYQFLVGLPSGVPIVHSEQTGKRVSFSWQELISAAIELGIDKP